MKLSKNENGKISSSEDVFNIMQRILMRQNKLQRQREYVWVIGLNSANDIVYIELIAIGSLGKCIVDPVEVFCFAVARKCKRIIIIQIEIKVILISSKNSFCLSFLMGMSKVIKIRCLMR